MTSTVVLLGPQRHDPQVAGALTDLGVGDAVAVVTAGWGQREGDDDELRRDLPGEAVNLGLYARWRDVVDRDPEFAQADRRRRDRLDELRTLYLSHLDHAVAAVHELGRHVGDDALRDHAVDDAIEVVRSIDDRHVERIAEIDDDFHDRWPPHERPVVAEHREAIEQLVAVSDAVTIAGGHVGVLARMLHLFNVAAAIGDRPVVAWSAGVMAVAERIVLFHDFTPHGPWHGEVHGHGVGLVGGVVPLPHAGVRLRLDDRERMRLFARRFAPARLIPMDRTTRVVCADRVCGPSAEVAADGSVTGGVPVTPAARSDRHDDTPRRPRRLAIEVLRDRDGLDARAVDVFLSQHESPIVEGDQATFLFRGEADAVLIHHRVVGLPPAMPMERLDGTGLWAATVVLPRGSRVEYHYEVVHDGHGQHLNDPLNPTIARNPMGTESVARATGYDVPDWVLHDPETRPGQLDDLVVRSEALGRDVHAALYLPARFRETHRYPLLVVHDGHDYLEYADAKTVLDNLIHRLEIAEVVAVFISSDDRLVEYAGDDRHHRFVLDELIPELEVRLPLIARPRGRCLVGASFGGIAAFTTAATSDGDIGALLLESTSFLVHDIGDQDAPPVFEPVVDLLREYRAEPFRVADRIYQTCGAYEPMIAGNRAMVPVLQATGSQVQYVEAPDGHNWENWRDRLRDGLSWLYPGPQAHVYE